MTFALSSLACFTSRRTVMATALLCAALLSNLVAAQTAPKVKFATSEGDFIVELYPDKAQIGRAHV